MDSRLSADDNHGVAFAITVTHVPFVGFAVLPTIAYCTKGIPPLQLGDCLQEMYPDTLSFPLRPHYGMPMRCIALLIGVVLHNKMTWAHLPHERQHLGVHLGTNAIGAELEGLGSCHVN